MRKKGKFCGCTDVPLEGLWLHVSNWLFFMVQSSTRESNKLANQEVEERISPKGYVTDVTDSHKIINLCLLDGGVKLHWYMRRYNVLVTEGRS